jgi:predicted amidohydrolase
MNGWIVDQLLVIIAIEVLHSFIYVCIYVFVCIYMYISGEVIATTDADESIIYADLQLDKIDEMRQGK